MQAAAPDSSAEKHLIKKRHASQGAKLHLLCVGQTHTHILGETARTPASPATSRRMRGAVRPGANRSRNALRNANANHISTTCIHIVCMCRHFWHFRASCLWLLTSHFHVKSQPDTHTLTKQHPSVTALIALINRLNSANWTRLCRTSYFRLLFRSVCILSGLQDRAVSFNLNLHGDTLLFHRLMPSLFFHHYCK